MNRGLRSRNFCSNPEALQGRKRIDKQFSPSFLPAH